MSIAARHAGARAAAPAAAREDAVAPRAYVGLLTRALGFGIDAGIITLVAVVVAALVSLLFSIINAPKDLKTAAAAVGAVLYVLWSVGYFVTFWATTGQTPGGRVMRIRVIPASGGGRLKPRRALLRFVGLTLAALPLFAGYLLILVDNRRRGLHDMLARTVVVDAPLEVEGQGTRRGAAARHPGPGA